MNKKSNKELKKQEKEYKKSLKLKEKEYKKNLRLEEKERKKQENEEKRKRKQEEKQELKERRDNFLSSKTGYIYTPSYIKANGKYASIFKIDNTYGLNHDGYEFGWFVDLIPENNKNTTIYFFEKDKKMSENEQRTIIKDNVEKNLTVERNTDLTYDKNATVNDFRMKDYRIKDLKEDVLADSMQEGFVDCDIYMMIISDNADNISLEAERIQNIFTEEMNGINLISLGGEQKELFHELFTEPKKDIYHYTWTTDQFAGNEHIVRKGLNDENGIGIGQIADNNKSGTAMMALDESFRINDFNTRRITKINNTGDIAVASHKNALILGYPVDKTLSASSMWGQVIANDVMLNGNKVFHIVMNNFRYFGTFNDKERKFAISSNVNEVLDYYDLNGKGLNPLEMYGKYDEDTTIMKQIFNNYLDKIVQIFYLISGRELPVESKYELRKLLEDFYIENKKWIRNFDKYPSQVSAINPVLNHDTFPTLGDFTSKLTSSATRSLSSMGTEKERDRIKTLKNALDSVLKSNGDIFNRPTTIDQKIHNLDNKKIYSLKDYKLNPVKQQFYFDISKLQSTSNILEAQFLNIFDYVASLAEENDVIMLHGLDNISVETIEYIKPTISLLKNNNIRFAYLFDDVASNVDSKIKKANLFNLKGILYHSLDESFDYTIIGTMTNSEFDEYEESLGGIKLPQLIRRHMTGSSASPDKFQIRRHSDGTNSLVYGDFII